MPVSASTLRVEGGAVVLIAEDLTQGTVPEVWLRFTELSVPANGGYHFNGGARLGVLALLDCQLAGALLNLSQNGSQTWRVGLTNSLFERVYMNLGSGTGSTLTVRGRNNLFRGCTLKLHPTAANNWEWRENLFDGTSIAQYSVAVANSHNGYWQSTRMIPNSADDVVLGSLTYAEGPLGRFYQPAGSALTDAGSRTAAAAGLYHHTTTVDQAKDGPTTKVDIGFHYIALADGQPVDTDHDGLADYAEDRNGNHVVDAGESNPENPRSINPDQPDGQTKAYEAAVGRVSYWCDVTRDFYGTVHWMQPDVSFTMRWWPLLPGFAYHVGDFSNCDPAPPPTHHITTRILWLPLCDALHEDYSVAEGWHHQTGLQAPPSADVPVPWERCVAYIGQFPPGVSPPAGTYTRHAETKAGLWTGGREWSHKPDRCFLLNVELMDKSNGASVRSYEHGEVQLSEPDNRIDQAVEINPVTANVMVRGKRVDANGQVFITEKKETLVDVTPDLASCSWFSFSMVKHDPVMVTLSWSEHPLLSAPVGPSELQDAFDRAMIFLARDDDDATLRIPDWDPQVIPGSPQFNAALYNNDDVPTYIEFVIPKAKRAQFPTQFPPGTTNNFALTNYLDRTRWDRVDELRFATFANIKVVNSIRVANQVYLAWGRCDAPCILVTRDYALSGGVLAHEYGHTRGLLHRGDTNKVFDCDVANPGVVNDPTALLRGDPGNPADPEYPRIGDEVNRRERSQLTFFYPGLFWYG